MRDTLAALGFMLFGLLFQVALGFFFVQVLKRAQPASVERVHRHAGVAVTERRHPGVSQLSTADAPPWLTLEVAGEEAVLITEGMRIPLADAFPPEIAGLLQDFADGGGYVSGGSAGLPAPAAGEPTRRAAIAFADLLASVGAVGGPAPAAVRRVFEGPVGPGRRAAARWLIRNDPPGKRALLTPLLRDSDERLRLLAAVELRECDALAALVVTSREDEVLRDAIVALAENDARRADELVASRIRGGRGPWDALLAAPERSKSTFPCSQAALVEVIGGAGPLPEPELSLATCARLGLDWEPALVARIREGVLTVATLQAAVQRGGLPTYEALRARALREEGTRLGNQVRNAVRAVGGRLGLEQDGEVSIGSDGGELAMAGSGELSVGGEGELAVAPAEETAPEAEARREAADLAGRERAG